MAFLYRRTYVPYTQDKTRHRHSTMSAAATPPAPPLDDGLIPVTILTGFLGSGKTTLQNPKIFLTRT